MKCPHCNSEAIYVSHTRHSPEGDIWRRRKCLACDQTFVSQEFTTAELKFPRYVENRKKSAAAEIGKAMQKDGGV